MRHRSIGITLLTAQFVALAAWAHHSHGNYLMTEYTEYAKC